MSNFDKAMNTLILTFVVVALPTATMLSPLVS